jgi:nucleotide-binding universal stress UspA family protein
MEDQSETPPVRVIVDEKDTSKDTAASSAVDATGGATSTPTPTSAATGTTSPPTSPPESPPTADSRRSPGADDYYSSRPKFDRLGNPIPQNRRPSAMSTVYGSSQIRLPGDLGSKDPRRPKSPAPATLPGDLGPNDPRRPRSRNASPAPGHVRHPSDASPAPPPGERILKDPKEPTPDDQDHRDSDDDADADNDNDTDAEDTKRGRGRKRPEPGRTTSGKAVNVRDESEDSEREAKLHRSAKPDPTKGESKFTFGGDSKSKTGSSEKKRVHPMSAFDIAPGMGSPLDSDNESHTELREAQKLSLTMSAVHSTPSAHRVIRQIVRGDYGHFQREAEEGRRRQRMYLVATDISPEAEHALEWTIGTVLRDGDTLFAVYAMDEDESGASGEGGVEIGKGAEMVRDTAAIVKGLQSMNVQQPNSPGPSPLARAGQLSAGDNRSHSRGVYGSAETERRRALEDITNRCVRMLRKTRLQCRVVVEVFHCKSPRHMITEVIDFLSPTMVIIGSRGQSAVKGVLLGSFSNYLVTKSSVPVMVARKRLRKHSKSKRNKDGTSVPYSGSGRPGRFSNMIEVPKGKGLRVKGWEQVGID